MSGSNNYTESEVAARIEELETSISVINRNTEQDPVAIVNGVQNTITSVLNSDVDAAYYLLKLLVNRHVLICSKILENIDLLERYSPVTRQDDPKPDETKLDRLIEIAEELEFAESGEREALLLEFSQVSSSLAKSSKTDRGVINPGLSPSAAKERSLELVIETDLLLETLDVELEYFVDALESYDSADFRTVSFSEQARRAAYALKAHVGNPDLSQAVLDSTILSSLLTQKKATKRDITIPKYEGPVTTLSGAPARLLGGTEPFILQESSEAALVLNGTTETTEVYSDKSAAPELSNQLSSEMFQRMESGVIYPGHNVVDPVITDGYSFFSSSGEVNGQTTGPYNNPIIKIPYLKAEVAPSRGYLSLGNPDNYSDGVNIQLSYYVYSSNPNSPSGGSVTPAGSVSVSLVDNGVDGWLISQDKSSVSAHTLVPTVTPDGSVTNLFFSGMTQQNQYARNIERDTATSMCQFLYNESGVLQTQFVATNTPGTYYGNQGFFQMVSSDPAYSDWFVEINYVTGEVHLTVGSSATPPSANATFETGPYYVYTVFGKVSYENGHIFIFTPGPLVTNSLITCSYAYLPIGHCLNFFKPDGKTVYWSNNHATIPPDSSFDFWGIYKDNTLLESNLKPLSNPITTPEDLKSAIDSIGILQANGLSVGAEQSGALSKLVYTTESCGSMARLCFPNYPADSTINTNFGAPTWAVAPTTLNQALSALYSIQGESFGKDTLFSQLGITHSSITTDDRADVSLEYNSLLTGQSIAEILPASTPEFLGKQFKTTVLPEQFEVGDDLKIRWDPDGSGLSRTPKVFHTKVAAIVGSLDPVIDGYSGSLIEVTRPLSLSVDDSSTNNLSYAGSWSFDLSRSKIKATSQSDAANSSLSVMEPTVGDGFGFPAGVSVTGVSQSVQLGTVDLHGEYPRPAYEIHPNDLVLEKYSPDKNSTARPIGRVTSVSGDTVNFEVFTEAQVYPYSELKIVALGWQKFQETKNLARTGSTELANALENNNLVKSATTYVESGSGQNQYLLALHGFRDAIDLIRNNYLDYDAHAVDAVNKLLNMLRQERMTVPLGLLMTAQFSEVSELTVAQLSDQMSVENLLVQAFDLLGGNSAFFEMSYTQNTIGDYYNRPEDDKAFNEPDLSGLDDTL